MIITIDGPAGAGKSSVAKKLAERLQFQFLDTGAMYRAVAWSALNKGVDVHDEKSVSRIASKLRIEFSNNKVVVDGQDVTDEIREPHVTNAVSEIADNAEVREHLVMLQREIASNGDYVCEGRDQGTVAFPNADCKIFLTATNSERAKRRFKELNARGIDTNIDDVRSDQDDRDQRDQQRPVGKLLMAQDAIKVVTDGMTLNKVVEKLEEIARAKFTVR